MIQAAPGTSPRVSVLQAWGQASPASPGLVPSLSGICNIYDRTGCGLRSPSRARPPEPGPGSRLGSSLRALQAWGSPSSGQPGHKCAGLLVHTALVTPGGRPQPHEGAMSPQGSVPLRCAPQHQEKPLKNYFSLLIFQSFD